MKIKSSTNLLLIKMSIVLFIPVGLLVFGMNYYANQCMENVVNVLRKSMPVSKKAPKTVLYPLLVKRHPKRTRVLSHK